MFIGTKPYRQSSRHRDQHQHYQRLFLHPVSSVVSTRSLSRFLLSSTMAIRSIESRLECLSVNDENDQPNGGGIYQKSKVKLNYTVEDVANILSGVPLDRNIHIRARIRYSINVEYEPSQSIKACSPKQQRCNREIFNHHHCYSGLTDVTMARLKHATTSSVSTSQRHKHLLISTSFRRKYSAKVI